MATEDYINFDYGDPKNLLSPIPPVDDVAVARPDAVPEVPVSVAAADPVTPEAVDHPHHYQGRGLESIEVIEAFDLDFCLGNTVKYVLRAGKKDNEIQDLKKAIWYLNRRIQQLEKANQ